MRKQITVALLTTALIADLAGCGTKAASTATTPASSLQQETLTLYRYDADSRQDMTVYYANDDRDILFIDLADGAELLNEAVADTDSKFHIETTEKDGIVTYTRENGSTVDFDLQKGKNILFYDFDGFFRSSYASASIDVLSASGFDEQGRPAYYSREGSNMSFEVKGSPIEVELGNHEIPMYFENGHGYIPLQTFSDLFLARLINCMLYNGESLFLVKSNRLSDELAELYYSAPASNRSTALADFTYNELALALDVNYGLKDQHEITTFEDYLPTIGLDDDLHSEDPTVFANALAKLCYGYFGDGHSGFDTASYRVGDGFASFTPDNTNLSLYDLFANAMIYDSTRSACFPDGIPAYQEIGNTAYITLDSFSIAEDDGTDYYAEPATADAEDTIGLIQYANTMIKRPDSPIRNVVLDLSVNGGGNVDAAIYVIGWYLGSATLDIRDTVTGNKSSVRYKVDVNGDRVFNSDDSVSSLNLYCLTSPYSFSCGNLVPAYFKYSGAVTLLGRSSGGGSCAVMLLSTADGNMIQISGSLQISTDVNGSFYDVDQGISVDYVISKPEKFYDRQALTDYINTLY